MRQMRNTSPRGGCNAFPTRGRGNLFGAPALTPGGYKRADVVAYNYYGPGKHLYLDVAVTAEDSATALKSGSADTTGAAHDRLASERPLPKRTSPRRTRPAARSRLRTRSPQGSPRTRPRCSAC